MKKVLIIAHSNMSLSGVPVVYMTIIRTLHKEYSFDILLFDNNDMYFEKEFLKYGGNIFIFNRLNTTKFKSSIVRNIKFSMELRFFLKNKMTISNYDIIHCFREKNTYSLFKILKKLGAKKIIYHINSADSAYPRKKGIKSAARNYYQKKAIKISNNVICVSKQVKDNWNYYGNCSIVLNCFNNSYFNKIIEKEDANLSLCQVATFSNRKNQLFSLEIMKKIVSQYPAAKLFLLGKEIEKDYLRKIHEFISENDLSKNVTLLPVDYNQKDLYKKSSFLLFPSKRESFGLVLLEAQACGVHCFASSTIPADTDLGNVDFIELDSNKWADSILKYYANNHNKRKAPENIQSFTQDTFSNNIKKIYND